MGRPRKLPAGMVKRGETYYAAFRSGGRLVRKRLSSNFRAAGEMLTELRSRADKGDFGLVDNDYPWVDLKTEFLRWARQSVRRPQEYAADLARLESFTTITSVRQITPAFVIGYRDWRLGQFVKSRRKMANGQPAYLDRKVSPRTINREVGTLHNLLAKAVQWKRIGSNPIKDVKPLRHDAPCKERRSLEASEVERLFAVSPEHLRPVWRMFMSTAVRRGELVNMRFADIDFEQQTVTVRASTAKNHKAREIPLDDTMLAILADLRAQAKDRRPLGHPIAAQAAKQAAAFSREHVFVSRANTPLRNNLLDRFYAVCAKAGIDDGHPGGSVDLHSLRVTCATLMLQGGANPKDVQAILGHSTLALTMRVYAKATDRGKRSAIGVLPFAKVSSPKHLVAVQNVPTLCASHKDGSQGIVRSRLA
ncbi:MAG TPA: site-specific integrase [Pirellulales bacterium]|nr:site-specific integrase [Pirellulales bacterium]